MRNENTIECRLQEIRNSLRVMQEYLDIRTINEDWHGVMDASADIRELLAEQRALLWVTEQE